MGILCSKPEDSEGENDEQYINEKHFRSLGPGYYQPATVQQCQHHLQITPLGVQQFEKSPILAQALSRASGVANAVVHVDVLDPVDIEEKIRWAKAQMRTITVRKDCLYIDYELIGRIPPGTLVKAY